MSNSKTDPNIIGGLNIWLCSFTALEDRLAGCSKHIGERAAALLQTLAVCLAPVSPGIARQPQSICIAKVVQYLIWTLFNFKKIFSVICISWENLCL